MYAAKNSVTGQSLFAGTEKIQMHEYSLGVAYGLRF
jgi:hypothetical protein